MEAEKWNKWTAMIDHLQITAGKRLIPFSHLTFFFPMLPFDPKSFLMFSKEPKGNIGKKTVKIWRREKRKSSEKHKNKNELMWNA